MENEKEPKPTIKTEDFEDHTIKCADCEKDLLYMVRVRPSEKNYKIIVKCPFCESESWLVELTGDYFQKTPKSLLIEEMYEENDVLLIIMKRR